MYVLSENKMPCRQDHHLASVEESSENLPEDCGIRPGVETPLNIILQEQIEPHLQRSVTESEMTSAAMEGYEACTEEAIRYLIEIENLPADDPMVIGLREYLFEKQKALAYSNQIPNFSLPTSHPVNYNSFEQCEEYSLRSDNLSDQSTDSIEISNITSESDMTSEQDMTLETEMAESVNLCDIDNMCLPEDKISAIRALTSELLSLMEQEDEFSDFYDDDDDDDDDDVSNYVMDNEEELDH